MPKKCCGYYSNAGMVVYGAILEAPGPTGIVVETGAKIAARLHHKNEKLPSQREWA